MNLSVENIKYCVIFLQKSHYWPSSILRSYILGNCVLALNLPRSATLTTQTLRDTHLIRLDIKIRTKVCASFKNQQLSILE